MQPERLAQHCTEAGLGHKAIAYWLEAGQQAVAGSAMTEALALLRKGLALVSSLPDSAARQEHELDLRIACGRALMVAKGYASREADQAFARARQLCEQLNRQAKLVSVLFGQFVIRFQRAELEQLRQDAQEIRQLGEASNDVPLEWLGCRYCGLACFGLGDLRVCPETLLAAA